MKFVYAIVLIICLVSIVLGTRDLCRNRPNKTVCLSGRDNTKCLWNQGMKRCHVVVKRFIEKKIIFCNKKKEKKDCNEQPNCRWNNYEDKCLTNK